MAAVRIPARFTFAVSMLDLAPNHRVLEFGCGNGLLAARIAEQVPDGRVTAIDRSATAIARAEANAPDVRFHHAELATFTADGRFDRIVGVNVNLFWTGDCTRECQALTTLLDPAGMVVLVYETPGAVRPEIVDPAGMVVLVYETPGAVRPEIVDRSVAALGSGGFGVEVVRPSDPTMIAICARPRQRDQTS